MDSVNSLPEGADSESPSATSVALNFAHVIWLFTTNIGSHQVQEQAYEAAKQGRARESLSPTKLHEMLLDSLEHSEQLQLLRDQSVLSALIPFFPLFKSHVKECANVQLAFRRKYWLHNLQLANFTWDSSVPASASSQLKYRGPISIYGCKNVHEILTSVLLAPLTREFRKEQEEADHALNEKWRDARVGKREKLWSFGWNLVAKAKQLLITGPVWNYGKTNVTMSVETTKEGAEEVVFRLATPLSSASSNPSSAVHQSEIRRVLHAASIDEEENSRTKKSHDHMREDAPVVQQEEEAVGRQGKEDL